MGYIWFLIIILLILIELATLNFVTIFFAVSGFISLIISLFYNNYFFEFIVFLVLGSVLFYFFRNWSRKKFIEKNIKIGINRIIGKQAIVVKMVSKNGHGEVLIKKKKWFAVSDEKIFVGEAVEVVKIDGIKLKVKRI